MKTSTFPIYLLVLVLIMSCNPKPVEKKSSKTDEMVEAMKDQQKVAKIKDGVFIHLSHGPEDPQRVLMALNMAKMMSDDKDVLLYLDIKGVFVVLKDAPDISFKAFPSSLQLLAELKEKGVEVIVCPGCLKAAEKTPEDVVDWVKIATKERFFDFTEGKIISIDY